MSKFDPIAEAVKFEATAFLGSAAEWRENLKREFVRIYEAGRRDEREGELADDRCESGCSESVTRYDADHVPMCEACYQALDDEPASAPAPVAVPEKREPKGPFPPRKGDVWCDGQREYVFNGTQARHGAATAWHAPFSCTWPSGAPGVFFPHQFTDGTLTFVRRGTPGKEK